MLAKPPETLLLDRIATPIGTALLVSDEDGFLRALDWTDYETRLLRLMRLQYRHAAMAEGAAPATTRAALEAYFGGAIGALSGVAWRSGGTEFQRLVWTALTAIPAGSTLSYGALAARIGVPAAVRAVGAANGANPISLVVPCHRVIGSDGTLTGYGGGLERKRWLLEHEGALARAA